MTNTEYPLNTDRDYHSLDIVRAYLTGVEQVLGKLSTEARVEFLATRILKNYSRDEIAVAVAALDAEE
jgi:hypothetical protein